MKSFLLYMLYVVVVVATTLGLTALMSSGIGRAEATSPGLRSLTNAERSALGIHALDHGRWIDKVAQNWADHMARTGQLAHNPRLTSEVVNWRYVGENVGVGPDIQSIQQAWMASKGHRDNVLFPKYLKVGGGVAHQDGKTYAVVVFKRPLR